LQFDLGIREDQQVDFINGIELCRRFHFEFVEPLISSHYPKLCYGSALIGPGSEVLGFDTEMSTDHDWGPRVLLFLRERDIALIDDIIRNMQSNKPDRFYGYPVDLKQSRVITIEEYLQERLGIDITMGIRHVDWLTFPSQVLAEITGGAVFRDDSGTLSTIRKQLQYYPHDIWLFFMASVWNRIGQEEHLAHRSGYVGDELGSSIIASRLIQDIMNLCFLMERHYAPYPKWFGTAFKKLNCAKEVQPLLSNVQTAVGWEEREEALSKALQYIARKHNQLGITERMDEQVSFFFDRPFHVIQGGKFAQAIADTIVDPTIRKLSEIRLIGGIDQITDNTDFRSIHQWHKSKSPAERNILRLIYDKLLE
jgi:hypothetical protein